jgi:hypothetical protein
MRITCKKIENSSYENSNPKETEPKEPEIKEPESKEPLVNNLLSFNIDIFGSNDFLKNKEHAKKIFNIVSYEKDDVINILYYIGARYKNHIISLYIARGSIVLYRAPAILVNSENMNLMLRIMVQMPIDEIKSLETKRLSYPLYGMGK